MIRSFELADIEKAAAVYSASWIESHRGICSETVLARHTPQKKANDLLRLLEEGWHFWLEEEGTVRGIVGVHPKKGEIAYLYVAPDEQGKGIGGSLLRFASAQLPENPRLWTLSSNTRAEAIYAHYGFEPTGNIRILNESTGLSEREWVLKSKRTTAS